MKKHGILNSHISKILADLGHTDFIVVADAGLPVPEGVTKIDLALKLGVPSFQDVVDVIAADMVIEKVTLAEEIKQENEQALQYIMRTFAGEQLEHSQIIEPTAVIEFCSHEQFKALTRQAKAVIRTGEATPFANCILQAGVHFG
ncbi:MULTISPECIES: D-ribose pyranase [Paenibacillus]|uniref:D-ribose pyranase n=1 Tax=Paenibacillus TaxID=44249 RepID=UPI000472E2DF|nr:MULTISPECIES: D-ribose pyranase [Paenibacillus]AJE53815.1 ribose ABC transporter [Paenibacillus polymyxa]AUO08646.1 D-ribose pyranase [Paenibacillus sp. lzh-N1]AZH29726.1 D-ribose pyranase [Paenibacillus sp. M-152]MBU9708684.1 D-ribose pyranase [Paenibacillus sp. AK121]MEE4570017.1 D-ribose pyranase [Paenibacillus polymyxa]